MMRYRKLGSTGLMVSEIGVGGGGLGHVWGATSDEAAQAAVDFALAQGINFFDVAPAYGDGRAEENLGHALQGRRERAVIATKVFLSSDDLTDIDGAIERSLTQSLERLQTEQIDVFQLHNRVTAQRGDARRSVGVDDVLGPAGIAAALHRLRDQGQVRFVGFTGVGHPEQVRHVMREGGLDSVQVYYNLLNASAATEPAPGSTLWDHGRILPLARELGMAAIGIRNLAAGALTGAIDREIDPDSLIGRDWQRGRRLEFLGRRAPLSQIAARFVLEQPAISSVVPGVKDQTEVADAIASIDLPPLSPDEQAQLDALAADDFGLPEPPASMM